MLATGLVGAVAGGIAGAIYSYSTHGEVRLQNVLAGAVIGGAIGLTGGAATAYFTTGSGVASTTLVTIGLAKLATGPAVSITNEATRVIGSFPEYLKKASEIGAKTFSLPPKIWNTMSEAQRWAANQKFLDRGIIEGAQFILESAREVYQYGPYLQKEIIYLLQNGYHFVENGTKLIKR